MKEKLKKYTELIEGDILRYFSNNKDKNKSLYEAMEYSISAGGKRIRPVLMLMSYEVFSDDIKKALPYAAAMEMIHTYSLIHDDLPSLDNDDYRRGKLTNHKVFGEARAILAGDALLNKAYEIVFEDINEKPISERKNLAGKILSNVAGTEGMIGGQIVDIESEGKPVNRDTLDYIHKNKTGALIKGSMEIGAILGGATEEQLKDFSLLGDKIGLAFQIKDDLLDIEGDKEKLGKTVGRDQELNKATYPSIYGIDKAKSKLEELRIDTSEILNKYLPKSKLLIELSDYLITRDH